MIRGADLSLYPEDARLFDRLMEPARETDTDDSVCVADARRVVSALVDELESEQGETDYWRDRAEMLDADAMEAP